jgi:hypothetical protein
MRTMMTGGLVRESIMLRDGIEELGEVQAVLLFRLVRWV